MSTVKMLRIIAERHPYAASLTNHVELAGVIYPVGFPDPDGVVHNCTEVSPLWGWPLVGTLATWKAMLATEDYLSVLDRLGDSGDALGARDLLSGMALVLSFYRDQARADEFGPHAL